MKKTRLLTKKEFYEEIYKDPDLRRLGPYKVVAEPGMEIFPIDVELPGREIYLGEGDFTGTFVAFCDTKAEKVDLGNSNFAQLYFDYLEVSLLQFGSSQASSIMFDRAKIERCDFEELRVQELYFDELASREIYINKLAAGLIFVGKLGPTEVNFETLGPDNYKILFDDDGAQVMGKLKREELVGYNYREIVKEEHKKDQQVRLIPIQEFKSLLERGTDLRSLGLYKVVPEKEGEILEIPTGQDQKIYFGEGDFTDVDIKFITPKIDIIRFDLAKFGSIVFEGGHIETIDLAKSKVASLTFRGTNVGTVFCDGINVKSCEFDDVEIDYVFLNNIICENLKFKDSEIKEIYASIGKHENIYFDGCKVRLFNGHEAKFKIIDFGKSEFERVVMRATTVEELLDASELRAGRFMVGYYDNNIENMVVNEATLGTKEGIEALTFRRLEPNELDREYVEARREVQIPKEFKLR